MMSPHQIRAYRWALSGAVLVVSYLAFAPLDEDSLVATVNDKLEHFAAFYCLALLLDFAFPRSPYGAGKMLVLAGYGFFIEIVQSQLPYRSFSLWDWLVDIMAVLVYAATPGLLRRIPWLRVRWVQDESRSTAT